MYQVIARKYRPQNFAELIGQEHVRTTLDNAITQGRIAHGYIFSGQRGTGKTTVARILARCLNCVDGPTPTPCGVCSSCLEIAAGNAMDVIEIDAASNRGINEMRELRENVRFRPARDRYKIFIIDEAHQITNEAFNALLKTLEEPPEWAVFVLCTTEAHKIPTTIASRCQQFSFRSVAFPEVVARMEWICGQENIKADPEVLAVLAQAGEGSVRDSLSALDQAIACCGQSLSADGVRELLGLFSLESMAAITRALEQSSAPAMLEVVNELERNGRSLQHFCRELSRYFRNLLVARISGEETRLIAASPQEQARMREAAAKFSEEDLTRFLQISLDLFAEVQSSLQPRFHLELGLMRMLHAGRLRPIEEALRSLGPGGSPGAAPVAPVAAPRSSPSTPPARQFSPAPASVSALSPRAIAPEIVESTRTVTSTGGSLKERLYDLLVAKKANFSADAVQVSEVIESGGTVEFIGPRIIQLGLKDVEVGKALQELLGRQVKIKITVADNGVAAAANAAAAKSTAEQNGNTDEELMSRALSHPDVRRFQELFPNSQVRGVRDLKE